MEPCIRKSKNSLFWLALILFSLARPTALAVGDVPVSFSAIDLTRSNKIGYDYSVSHSIPQIDVTYSKSNRYSDNALAFHRVSSLESIAVELAKEQDVEKLRILARHSDQVLRKAAVQALYLLGDTK